MKKTIYLAIRRCILAAVLLFAHTVASAQIKTVIPANDVNNLTVTNTNAVNITFVLSALPAGCTITNCAIKLTCLDNVSGPLTLQAHLIASVLPGGESMINNVRLKKDVKKDSTIDIAVSGPYFPKSTADGSYNNTTYNIRLQTSQIASVSFYPSGNSAHQGYSPQLVISYTLPKIPTLTDWSSSNANAQHNGQTNMRYAGFAPSQYNLIKLDATGPVKQNMVIYKNQLYTICTKDGKTGLFSVDLDTYKAICRADNLAPPNVSTTSAIDPFGHLYFVNGDNQIRAIDIDNNYTRSANSITTPSKIINSLSIGPDGCLYVPTDDHVAAYSSFPQNKLLWNLALDGSKSSVTLNKEGGIAYVVSVLPPVSLETAAALQITAIDADNGKAIQRVKISGSDPGTPPIPVIDRAGNVFVTNKFSNATKLYIFNANLDTLRTIGNNGDAISMVTGSNGIYFINKNEVFRCDGTTVTAINRVEGLRDIRSLISDQSNNIYCLAEDGKKLYSFNDKPNSAVTTTDANIFAVMGLITGTDGTLYTATSNELYAIKPASFSGGDYDLNPSSQEENMNNLTFRAQKITIKSGYSLLAHKILTAKTGVYVERNVIVKAPANKNADAATNIVIKSGGGIVLSPGFTVQQGAVFDCKTGY